VKCGVAQLAAIIGNVCFTTDREQAERFAKEFLATVLSNVSVAAVPSQSHLENYVSDTL